MILTNQKLKKRLEIFEWINMTFDAGIRHFEAEVPREWLKDRGLTPEVTGAGFCSGQFKSKNKEKYMHDLEFVGFIRANNIIGKNKKTGYIVFADYGITFPLRDVKGNVVNFFGIPIRWRKKHIAFLNDEGIYPAYPHEMTTRLILVITVLDAATILESRVLTNRDSVMCIPNGIILPQHQEAIKRLPELKSIVWITTPKIELKNGLQGRIMPEGYITKSKKKV